MFSASLDGKIKGWAHSTGFNETTFSRLGKLKDPNLAKGEQVLCMVVTEQLVITGTRGGDIIVWAAKQSEVDQECSPQIRTNSFYDSDQKIATRWQKGSYTCNVQRVKCYKRKDSDDGDPPLFSFKAHNGQVGFPPQPTTILCITQLVVGADASLLMWRAGDIIGSKWATGHFFKHCGFPSHVRQ